MVFPSALAALSAISVSSDMHTVQTPKATVNSPLKRLVVMLPTVGDIVKEGGGARKIADHTFLQSLLYSVLRQYCFLSRQFNYIGICYLVMDTLLAAIESDPEKEKA